MGRPGAVVVGDVRLGAYASVWYSAVIRAEGASIEVGADSNIQDGCVMHADLDLPITVGTGVSIGHAAVLHGCRVEDGVLVGMGAILLDKCRIGGGSLIGAGALVAEEMVVPPNSLVLGSPGRVIRQVSDHERARIVRNAGHYRELASLHRDAVPVPR